MQTPKRLVLAIFVESGEGGQELVSTVVEENETDMEVTQQGVFGVLLFTVRPVVKVHVLLGEASGV